MLSESLIFDQALYRRMYYLGKKICTTPPGVEVSGLLKGANSSLFAPKLDIHAAAKLVSNPDAIFRTAIAKDLVNSEKNAELYLRDLSRKASKYLNSRHICSRLEVQEELHFDFHTKGRLTFVTGGCSVGKSKILMNALMAHEQYQIRTPLEKRISIVLADGHDKKGLDVGTLNSVSSRFTGAVELDLRRNVFTDNDPAEVISALANKRPFETNHTLLILDNAETYFQMNDAASVQRSMDLYHALVKQTKQLKQMSVMLVSSNSLLLYQLRQLGLDTSAFTSTLVVNEPSPQECLDLLRIKFEVGAYLSIALLDCFGGNVYQICLFLQRLARVYLNPLRKIQIAKRPLNDLSIALSEWNENNRCKEELLKVLERLSHIGVVPFPSCDEKILQLLIKHKIGRYVSREFINYGNFNGLGVYQEGIVPDSQLMRVLIASKLVQLKEEDRSSTT